MVRRNTRRLNRKKQRKQKGGTGGISSGYYKTLVPVDANNALAFSGIVGVSGCSAPAVDVFNGNSLDQAFLSASGVAPSQGGGRKRRTRKGKKSRKTKRKQRGGALPVIVPLAVASGGYYLWNRYTQDRRIARANRAHLKVLDLQVETLLQGLALLSASGVAPSQGGGRKRRTRKVKKSRKVRRTKRKQRGGALPIIVPLAVASGGYYLWRRHAQDKEDRRIADILAPYNGKASITDDM